MKYTNIEVEGNVFQGERDGMKFSASFDLFLISQARDKGCDFEDLADGFGPGRGTLIAETGESDWSGIRDSTPKAMNAMLERALNHLFGEKEEECPTCGRTGNHTIGECTLSEQARVLLKEIRDCDGAEVHEDFWPVAMELVETGLISLGSARGPARQWKRGELRE